MAYKVGFFQLDNEEQTYKGIFNPSEHWNGWKCPLFDYQTAKAIIDSQMTLDECIEHSCSRYDFSEYPKGIIDKYEDGVQFFPVVNFEGVEYYAIGCMNWTWYEVVIENVLDDLIENKIDDIFSSVCEKVGLCYGDISPDQEHELKNIKKALLGLSLWFVERNK